MSGGSRGRTVGGGVKVYLSELSIYSSEWK